MARTSDSFGLKNEGQLLTESENARERLTAFYRDRDAADHESFSSGDQKIRGSVYAEGLARLLTNNDVYESYRVLAAAGIELPPKAVKLVESQTRDWGSVCRIDCEGRVWTASLRDRGYR